MVVTVETRTLNTIDKRLVHVARRVDTLDKAIAKAFLTIEARA